MQTSAIEMQLRAIARERIHRLELPRVAPRLLWAGHGSGAVCALCGNAVSPAEIEHEIEEELNGGRQIFHFHVSCQRAWRLETEIYAEVPSALARELHTCRNSGL